MNRRVRVAVLAGGRSSEHDISLASARSVLEALDPERYEAVSVAIGRDGGWELGPAASRQALVGAGGFRTPAIYRALLEHTGAASFDDLVLHGSPESCREQIGRYVENGVTTPVLAVLPLGGVDTRQAVARLAPS